MERLTSHISLLLVLALLLSACAAAPTSTTPNTSTEPTKAVQETQDSTKENIEGTTATEDSTIPDTTEPPQQMDVTQPSTEPTVPITEPTVPTEAPTTPTDSPVITEPVPTYPVQTTPPTVPTEPNIELKFSYETIELDAGKTKSVAYTYTGTNILTWRSDNSSVATVDQNGVITGISSGSAVISVSDGTVTARCTVTVNKVMEEPSSYTLSISPNKVTLEVGKTQTLSLTYTGSGKVTWKTSNSSVATVSSSGKVTAVGAGTATITATDGVKNSQAQITVNKPVEVKAELKFSVSKPEVEVGKTYKAEYTYTGSKSLTWSSDNTSVATVNSNGVITGVKAGSAMIKVTDGTVTARCTVKVKEAPAVFVTSININVSDGPIYNNVTRYVGDYLWFVVDTDPNDATDEINVKSSNSSVVSVSTKNGYGGIDSHTQITLNFKSAGTATITLTSGDGAVTQSYTIHVKADYDFNPGSGLLSPEKFADYATRVMCANGFTEYPCTSWRLFTLSANQLTFARAVSVGQSCVHEWWPNEKRYCQIVYVGQDEDGNYVFHECWG